VKALTDALAALLPSTVTVHRGTVPSLPTFPYVLVMAKVPDALERSQARRKLLTGARVRCTVVGLSMDSVLIISERVVKAMDGARIDPPGWVTGSVENVPNSQWITEDTDVTDMTSKKHPLYAVLDFIVTASQSPA